MIGPYRGGETSAPPSGEATGGLVEELIAQFADPLAFYRELVQNSIDAGASSIAATLAWEADAAQAELADPPGMLTASVRDDGCGMGRAVLEERLTVLFRSGKENDETKIGKFGVGFVSVLAVDPVLVAVRTSLGDGEQWTLHLRRDQSYELFRAEGGPTSGTTVTLHIAMPRSAVADFVAGSERALVTWCRHTEVPVRFVAQLAGASEPLREARIDRPFDLPALASVEATKDGTRVAAGLPDDAQPYLAYFNRGLLLHETRQEVFGPLVVKIMDSRLEHTLSRDNVRRDEHHDRAMRFARHVVDTLLAKRVREILDELADGRRTAPPVDGLLAAALAADLDIGGREVRVPLMHPVRGARSITISALDGAYAAEQESELTRALAERGTPVVDLRVAASKTEYRTLLERIAGRHLAMAEGVLILATPVENPGSDSVLLHALSKLLTAIGRAPDSIAFVRASGAHGGAMFVSGVGGGPPAVLTVEQATRDPFRRLRRAPIWFCVDAPLCAAARRAAEEAPRLAAALLARALLVARDELDEALDERWLAESLALSGEGP